MKCRVCMQKSENFLEIANANSKENLNIVELIEKHLDLKIFFKDNNEKSSICHDCWDILRDFHEFYKKIDQLHKEDIQLGNTVPLEVEVVFDEIKEEPIAEMHWQSNEELYNCGGRTGISNPLNIVENEKGKLKHYDGTLENENRDDEDCWELKEFADDDDWQPESGVDESDLAHPPKKSAKCKQMKMKNSKTSQHLKSKGKVIRKPLHLQLQTYNTSDDELIRKHIPFNCGECGHNVEEFDQLKQHFAEHHVTSGPQRAYIRCCGRKILCGKRKYLIQHAYRHENPEHFKCSKCQRVFVDEYVLQAHIISNHPNEEDLKFQCEKCDKRFAKKRLLEWHLASHVPEHERTFFCYECTEPKGFASNRLLRIHVFAVHRRTRNVCHICAKVISDNVYFERHVRSHTEQIGPRVQCPRPDCQTWLKDKYSLKDHMKRHKDEGKTFECEKCGRTANNRRALRSHIRNTHSTAIYTCDECHKTFKKALSLKEHMAQHTGEKLYKCPFCERTFNSNANMHSHKKKMHPVEYELWRKSKMGANPEQNMNLLC